MQIDFLNNEKNDDVVHDENIRLAHFAKIMDSEVSGNLFVGLCSCINRSQVGRYVGLGYFAYLADAVVGNYCTFGSRVSIGAFSHPTDQLTLHEVGHKDTSRWYGETVHQGDTEEYLKIRSEKTTIGNDVWIGDNAVVIKGVTIGDGAVIGAGSIVTKDIEPFSIAVGNPAKVIRKRLPEETVKKVQDTQWWNYTIKELNDIPFDNIALAVQKLEAKNKQ